MEAQSKHPFCLKFIAVLLFLVRICFTAVAPKIFGNTGCGVEPKQEGFKVMVYQKNEGVLITCAEEDRSYIKKATPDDNIYGKIYFSSYNCLNNRWVNEDLDYQSKYLRCTRGCSKPAEKESLHADSKKEDCAKLNSDDSVDDAFIHCELKCKDGYYSDAAAENHLSVQRVYCKEFYDVNTYWEINEASSKKPFVKCVPGCFMYGSDREDVFGMLYNFKDIGMINGVKRYTSGELQCDSDNGYIAISDNYSDSLKVNCAGDHWEPAKAKFYCVKGCRKPGGRFGGKKITGYSFGCSEGTNGWYIQCAFSCDFDEYYTIVDRNYKIPSGLMAEIIKCEEGKFDMSSTTNICVRECTPGVLRCPESYSCTGIIRNSGGFDSGRRFCLPSPSSRTQHFTELMQSSVSYLMANTFGSYDWLL